ncbi:COP9 signalosome complex subunit 9 isoform X2 [Hypomesus transpacificus]|uniref:COP9 signalosome complex subunit 9 isoform X2 n=1 Tax=Hypomesus transpacificus TaxID=137520 RepID=UPI001F082F86|nr:COP9 signalosome complex subunit 9 isoform X2 [Hypomesus transpacificus]
MCGCVFGLLRRGGGRVMAAERMSFSCLLTTALLATILLPEFLSAGPIVQNLKGDEGHASDATVAMASPRRLVRNRRNISWYKQHADFWSWYKFFTDNGNQEAVQELDRVYLAYLQNKNRAEGRRSYKAYLSHLGDIYKSCADSEDPNCVASYTSRPKPEAPKPAPKPAPIKVCDPYRDPYCLYAALAAQTKGPAPAPAPVKAPAPLYVRSPVAVKDPWSGYYFYAPSVESFLSKEQKSELLRICASEDVECLQYHLRAAYGYKPSAGALPSYAHLGCNPKTDPNCKPQLVQKAPSGLYLRYPNCDPHRDPYCAYAASLQAPRAPAPPAQAPAGPGSCNPLFEDGCNPLTATKYATPPEEFQDEHRDEAAAMRAGNANANDPFAMYRQAAAAAMHRRAPPAPRQQYPAPPPHYEEPPQEDRHPLGPRGKTKEGYDCFIGYDQECYPLKPSEPRSGAHRHTAYPAEPYEPHLNADGSRSGVREPTNPDCDPEYDSDCRLSRYEPEQPAEARPEHHAEADHQGAADQGEHHYQGAGESEQEQYEAEPYQSGQEESYGAYPPHSQGMPSFQDMLRGYGDQYPEQGDHRAYADDYRKK